MTAKKGSNYWVSQMIICGVASVLLFVLGVGTVLYDKEEPGRGVIYILGSFLFTGAFIWLVVNYRRMSGIQRAIFAWAVTQQHSNSNTSDIEQLNIAGQAAAGTLPYPQLQMLQALDPANPYPAPWPTPPAIPTSLLPE